MAEFGMFTDAGEELMTDVVRLARKYQLNDRSVTMMLQALAENEVFAESTDTVVRERVFASVSTVSL
jgi:hypothetical protein